MSHRFLKFFFITSLLILGGVLLNYTIVYATLTLDSTSLSSDGALTLKSASSSLTTLGDPDQSGVITIASSTQTLTLNLGVGSGAATVNIATGTSTAKTINIGTGTGIANVITIGAASTTLSVGASSTFGAAVGFSSLTSNTFLYLNGSRVLTTLASSTAGQVLTATSTAPYFTWEERGIPTGAIMFFNLSACPTGWTENTASRGRYIVGLPASGSLASTTGTALSDKENRAVGEHAHDITDPGHTHGINIGITSVGTGGDTLAQANSNGSVEQRATSKVTGITITATGTTAGTNAPYIQYLACSKN